MAKIKTKLPNVVGYVNKSGKKYFRTRYQYRGKDELSPQRFNTEREAYLFLEEFKKEVESKSYRPKEYPVTRVNNNRPTVNDILREFKEVWVSNLTAGNKVSQRTLNDMEQKLEHMIRYKKFNNLGEMFIDQLNNEHLYLFKQNLFAQFNQYGERYSISTIRKYCNYFYEAFNGMAALNDKVRRVYADLNWSEFKKVSKKERDNVVQLSLYGQRKTLKPGETITYGKKGNEITLHGDDTLPKRKRTRKNEATFWTNEQFDQFQSSLSHVIRNRKKLTKEKLIGSDYYYYVILSVLTLSGLRIGEVRALQYNDFYKKDGINLMLIDHSIPERATIRKYDILHNKDPWNTLFLPKNRKKRVQAISPELMKILDEYKEIRRPIWEGEFLFPKLPGTTLTRKRDKFCKEAGVPIIRTHDLRHTYAYMQRFDNETESKIVAVLLGHSDDGSLVNKIYAPSTFDTNEKIVIKHAKKIQQKKKR